MEFQPFHPEPINLYTIFLHKKRETESKIRFEICININRFKI